MIELEPFTENDFQILKSWIITEKELFQFAGPIFSYPLTDEQLIDYVNMPDKKPLKVVLTATRKIIGHCELNFENNNQRLSRILIGDKAYRGKGLGAQIVLKMMAIIFENTKIKEVDLNVFDWNIGAIKCYEKVGFKIDHNKTTKLQVSDEVWTRLNMVYCKG